MRSLTSGSEPSSSAVMARQVLDALGDHGVAGGTVRAAGRRVLPGTAADLFSGAEWPRIRRQIHDAEVLVA
ncbi:hypothetical protein [Pseudonocardia alni]|uniref:Uncharacterized protein n=1 Tax=Pseudonocardia alni TaxID=33907 RepID=A0A852VXX9_PSEA5|nr:hypothetical protein [Pseudonocardia antarctica]NYG00880.1 hypothetical protein [Pseudonocardia antarctica]